MCYRQSLQDRNFNKTKDSQTNLNLSDKMRVNF